MSPANVLLPWTTGQQAMGDTMVDAFVANVKFAHENIEGKAITRFCYI